jgi:hypothetical protein
MPAPALFDGDITRITEIGCPTSSSDIPACPVGACGFEVLTLRTIQVFSYKVPTEIKLYHPQTGDCKETEVLGRRLLVSVLPDGTWSVFQVLHYDHDSLATALPNESGCLGSLDIKPVLPTKGGLRERPSIIDRAASWRADLTEHSAVASCGTAIPEQLNDVAVRLTALVNTWQDIYGFKHKMWSSY